MELYRILQTKQVCNRGHFHFSSSNSSDISSSSKLEQSICTQLGIMQKSVEQVTVDWSSPCFTAGDHENFSAYKKRFYSWGPRMYTVHGCSPKKTVQCPVQECPKASTDLFPLRVCPSPLGSSLFNRNPSIICAHLPRNWMGPTKYSSSCPNLETFFLESEGGNKVPSLWSCGPN